MTNIHRQFDSLVVAAIATLLVVSPSVRAVVPISGRPVATMTIFDTTMTDFMEDNDIEASVLGIMNNSQVVFLRGYGTQDDGIDMPENALVRLASCNKPITAAAIRYKDAQSASFSVNSLAFNLNGNGGVLNSVPFGGLGDARLDDITVLDLLRHRGGWDRNISPDYTNQERTCANAMDVSSPPGRSNMMRWILGKSLDFAPGTQYQYSNIGYMALGLIVSTSDTGYINYVHQNVLTSDMWIPSTELERARTFRVDRNLREPWYESDDAVFSVFDSTPWPGIVYKPYGGNDIEGRLGLGGVIASAPAMLTLGNTYHIAPDSSGTNPTIGLPIDATNPLNGSETHSGSKSGVNTVLWHRSDGVVVFAFFSKDKDEYDGGSSGHYGSDFVNLIDPILDAGSGVQFTWPTTTSDGFWVQTNSVSAGGQGGYHDPLLGVDDAMAYVTDGSKLRLKAGTSTWTGTLNKKLLIDAPLGNAIIGQ